MADEAAKPATKKVSGDERSSKKELPHNAASREKTMSEKKIVVSKGMLHAARSVFYVGNDPVDEQRKRLEAALRWWSENSNGPTVEQVREFGGWAYGHEDQIITGIAMWQSRCFLEPEPVISPFAKSIIRSFRGVTLSPEDADAILEELGHVAHGWNRYEKDACGGVQG
jgi:hypothetical protein